MACRTTSARARGRAGTRRRVRRLAGALLATAVGSAGSAGGVLGQAAPAVRIRVDNDGFDFWKRPWRRTDGDYTSGVRIEIQSGRAPLWRALTPRARPCADVPDHVPRCSSVRFVIGQDIYTPPEDSQPYSYPDWRRQRPYAGWLYAGTTVRTVRRSTVRSIELTVGVTGPPSLADRTQREAHRAMRDFTTLPVGWETQVRFEPGVIASADQQWLLFSGGIGGVRLIDAVVGAGAQVGNIVTNAEARGDVRVGVNLTHPWRRARRRGPVELIGTIGVRGQGIARSIFLDGNTLRPDRRVKRVPWVGDVHGSVGIRLGPVVLAYAVNERSREYVTGPRSHTFGSLLLGFGGGADVH